MPIGGKLRLKGDKKKGKKRELESDGIPSQEVAVGREGEEPAIETSSILTEAQKKHMAKKIKMESVSSGGIVKTTYRERVENFNMHLATLTEHNDIPRVSAAGNG
jgi:protein FAM32A